MKKKTPIMLSQVKPKGKIGRPRKKNISDWTNSNLPNYRKRIQESIEQEKSIFTVTNSTSSNQDAKIDKCNNDETILKTKEYLKYVLIETQFNSLLNMLNDTPDYCEIGSIRSILDGFNDFIKNK